MIGAVRWALRFVLVILLLVLALGVARRFVPNPLARVAEAVGIVSTERRSSASIILEELREIYLLNTVEYSYQAVFPYDFYPAGTEIASIMEKIRTRRGTIEQILTDEEELYFDAYNLAQELGIATGPTTYEFLVVPVVVSAGLDLEGVGAPPEEWAEIDGDRVRIVLPEASVTEVTLRDLSSAEYGYPDLPLSPDEWQRVAKFVSERIRQRAIGDGILARARENVRELVRELVTEAGFDEVEIGLR